MPNLKAKSSRIKIFFLSLAQKAGWWVIYLSHNLTYCNNSSVDAGRWAPGHFFLLWLHLFPEQGTYAQPEVLSFETRSTITEKL